MPESELSGSLFAISSKLVDSKHVLHTGKYESLIVISVLEFPKIPVVPSPINHNKERLPDHSPHQLACTLVPDLKKHGGAICSGPVC